MQALDRRLRLGECAKADTLNAPADHVPSRDLHEPEIMNRAGVSRQALH
jgi:hypothetical protein